MRILRGVGRLGLAALIMCISAACQRGAKDNVVSARPSVILVSIDTLRADHVGVRGLTPALDAFAPRAVTFTSAWSHVPLTLPAHGSMLTGLLPTHHGIRDNLGYELRAGETLAERFKKAGFATGGFVSSTVLARQTGVARGFDVFDDQMPKGPGSRGLERAGTTTVAQALSFVKQRGQGPFFLFVHLYEPHTPYTAPRNFEAQGLTAYDHEVAAADDAVRVLLEGLRALGVNRPAIAITSDHGEGLGDHGEQEHGLLLYAEALRVPLLISWPDGSGNGVEIDVTVRQVDIAPTLLEIAGLDSGGTDGAPLRPTPTERARPAYSESFYPRIHFGWSDLASAVEGRWHYIAGPKPELYDLDADPGETSNLAADPARPGAAMARYLEGLRRGATVEAQGKASKEAEERLRALGYLGATRFRTTASGANPRDKLAFYQPFMTAFTAAHAAHALGDFKKSAEQYRNAIGLLRLEKGLTIPKLHFGLADSLARLGQVGAAEKEFHAELALDPTSIETRTALGTMYWSIGRDQEARAVISEIATRNPGAGETEYAAVIRAFEVLGDAESASAWRTRALNRGR